MPDLPPCCVSHLTTPLQLVLAVLELTNSLQNSSLPPTLHRHSCPPSCNLSRRAEAITLTASGRGSLSETGWDKPMNILAPASLSGCTRKYCFLDVMVRTGPGSQKLSVKSWAPVRTTSVVVFEINS